MPHLRPLPLLLCCLVIASVGCRVKDIRTATVHAPGVRTADDARTAIEALGSLALVGFPQEQPQRPDSIADDPAAHTVTAVWHHPSAVRTISIVRVVAHYDRGEIDVTYDSMKIARKNLELAVSEAGFLVKAEPYDFEPPPQPAARP